MREAIAAQDAGSPLGPGIAAVLGAGLGVDASPIRVHADSRAAAATSHLGVRAFTWGAHVYLANGESPQDVALLAHEVTHAVQQSAGPAVQLFGGPTSGAHASLEREAQTAGSLVASGGSTTVVGRTSGATVQGAWGWISKAAGFIGDVAGAVKDRVLSFVREKARSVPGYDLLGVALGRDPITQAPVERTAVNLVRGVIGLVPGGAALFANLEQAKVIQRASEWLEVEIGKLGLTWASIRQLFSAAWDALSIGDLASPGTAWDKLKNIFGPPLSRLAAFAVAAGRKVMEFVFEGALALAGSAGQKILAIFRRIGSVFNLIVADPVKFLSNLLGAIKGGVGKFKDNILAHLKTGLFEWLMGAMKGALTLPSKWDFGGILSVILQVLGLTWSTLRGVLVKIMGEPAVAVVEKVFDFVVTAVTKGLPAVWEKIKEFASDLADTVISGIRDWIVKSVVGAAITKLVTMFNPVGAIIQGVITIYNTVMFFIERAEQIGRLVSSIVDSVENIAKGNVSAAVSYIEKTMANTLPVILGFLSRLAGLGKVTEYVRDIIAKVKGSISNALEKVGLWIKEKAKALVAPRTPSARTDSSPSATDSPQSSAVKTAALTDAATRLKSSPVETPAQLDATLAATEGAHRATGLKSLHRGAASIDELTLVAEASAPQTRQLRWTDAFRAHAPNAQEIRRLREEFKTQGFQTTGVVTVDGLMIDSVVSGGGHAEEKILYGGPWDRALEIARKKSLKSGHAEIAILINRSPCHSICTPKLTKALSPEKKIPGVTYVLAATGTYEPSYDLSDAQLALDAEDFAQRHGVSLKSAMASLAKRGHYKDPPDTPPEELKGGVTLQQDIVALANAGWQLKRINARTDPSSAGREWLKGIERVALPAVVQDLKGGK